MMNESDYCSGFTCQRAVLDLLQFYICPVKLSALLVYCQVTRRFCTEEPQLISSTHCHLHDALFHRIVIGEVH